MNILVIDWRESREDIIVENLKRRNKNGSKIERQNFEDGINNLSSFQTLLIEASSADERSLNFFEEVRKKFGGKIVVVMSNPLDSNYFLEKGADQVIKEPFEVEALWNAIEAVS